MSTCKYGHHLPSGIHEGDCVLCALEEEAIENTFKPDPPDYKRLYEEARTSLEEIRDWLGNDYCMRDMAKEAIRDLDELESTGRISF